MVVFEVPVAAEVALRELNFASVATAGRGITAATGAA
jgi:hypothetical protein